MHTHLELFYVFDKLILFLNEMTLISSCSLIVKFNLSEIMLGVAWHAFYYPYTLGYQCLHSVSFIDN